MICVLDLFLLIAHSSIEFEFWTYVQKSTWWDIKMTTVCSCIENTFFFGKMITLLNVSDDSWMESEW